MKYFTLIGLVLIYVTNIHAQDSLLVNKKYFEDQLYFGITNNVLINKPENVEQKGLSSATQIGVIKDISLNKRGNIALGIGLGYSFNTYKQNIKIPNNHITSQSVILDKFDFNRIETHSIEIPIEMRIRLTSTPTIYKFWRIYLGGKIGYIFSSRSLYKKGDVSIKTQNLSNLRKVQFGPQISVGYNALNIYAFYNMQRSFLEDIDNATISQINFLSFGLQFYLF